MCYVKNNFLKIKKNHWHAFRHEKLFEKQSQPQYQILSKYIRDVVAVFLNVFYLEIH